MASLTEEAVSKSQHAAAVVADALVGHDAPPADPSANTRAHFDKFASVTDPSSGDKLMTQIDFIEAITPPPDSPAAAYHKIPREQYGVLFQVADRRRAGQLTLHDYTFFENLLSRPDAEYEIAFRLFDREGTGIVKYDDFLKLYKENKSPDALPFDWNAPWASLYLGSHKTRSDLSYAQFSQMLRGVQGERVRQAFMHFDKKATGHISPEEFQEIIVKTQQHKLSDHLLENLHTLCNVGLSSKISYAHVRAFQNIMKDIDLVEVIIRKAVSKSPDGRITRSDFMNEAAHTARWGTFTPTEADVLFHFASLDNQTGRLSLQDFSRVVDPSWKPSERLSSADGALASALGASPLKAVLGSMYNFGLGAIAGAFGATMVYPIDLVKTRMQNQRVTVVGERLYLNSIDCAKKVIKNEGFTGLYRGLGPQLVGVAPEKAIKLTVNDLIRGYAAGTGEGGKGISLPWEIAAGGTAGGCQVIFTNPLEIVKIRLQVQGEMSKNNPGLPRRSALWIVKNLGLLGLYKGASACLLRDIPFSAIYFPTYAHFKKDYFGESETKKLGILQLLASGAIAGMPAAYLTTPCDVIKTRLQVEARKGETNYRGLVHCAKTVYKEEGFKAFFKGGPARILRSSPQFGFTLAAYEVLQSVLPFPGAAAAKKEALGSLEVPSRAAAAAEGMPWLRSRNAMKTIMDLDQGFGRRAMNLSDAEWRRIRGMGQAQ
ncbi:Mitoferrin [Drechslerella dactyloides]|uniref:Mitochondrial aspartate-glutamate transporter AGC1 n=1 Tax=Drechslerella dactyloides TaxID=74499 RepID=A0AAD6IWE6_DREDA|nr:Mitoferrin [Drechslerella dactyloides]